MKNKLKFKLGCLTFLPILCLFIASCSGNNNPTTYTVNQELVDKDEGDKYIDKLPDDTKDGTIIQAFNWTYNQILDNLDAIANAGFKTIQTSPVQQPKSGGASWWAFYQPLSFSIADNSPLGTKNDLKKLCDEAEKKNISIIVDIVFNHLANISDDELEADGTPKVSPDVEKYEPEIYALRNANGSDATFHHNPNATGSGAITQVYSYGALPDLNTSNKLVQRRSLDLLKECIDVGVDGFRFDAAKHIETPNDPEYSSDFWPCVLGEAKKYYKEKTGKDLYAYGEILNDVEGNRDISYYTEYMDVTDNGYIAPVRSNITSRNASNIAAAKYTKNAAASKLVTWIDSHDTYTDGYPLSYEARVYSILASRQSSRPMYLAHPDEAKSVGIVNNYNFESELIAVSNRFHNKFINCSENQFGIESIYINERYSDSLNGALICDTNHQEEVDVTFDKLPDGIYYDQLTGNAYIIENKKAHLKLDESGVAVLTRTKNEAHPRFEIDKRGGNFLGSISINVNASYITSATYQINDGEIIKFDGNKKIDYNQNQDFTIKFEIKNNSYTIKREYKFNSVKLVDGYFNVLNLNSELFEKYEVYIWSWSSGQAGTWSKDYKYENGVMLIDFKGQKTQFLIALLPKGYEITATNKWDDKVIKQTKDINVSDQFFDASGL